MLRALALSLVLATPISAQVIDIPYNPNGETARVSGPYARFNDHVLKLSARKYAVMFEPGYVDIPAAVRAVTPLCAAQGRQAQGVGAVSPADVVIVNGTTRILQGYRVVCR